MNKKPKTRKKEHIKLALGDKLREARDKLGISQFEAAKKAHVSETFFAETERAESNPAFSRLERMFNSVGLELTVKKIKR